MGSEDIKPELTKKSDLPVCPKVALTGKLKEAGSHQNPIVNFFDDFIYNSSAILWPAPPFTRPIRSNEQKKKRRAYVLPFPFVISLSSLKGIKVLVKVIKVNLG